MEDVLLASRVVELPVASFLSNTDDEVLGKTQTTLTVYPRVDVDHRGTTR